MTHQATNKIPALRNFFWFLMIVAIFHGVVTDLSKARADSGDLEKKLDRLLEENERLRQRMDALQREVTLMKSTNAPQGNDKPTALLPKPLSVERAEAKHPLSLKLSGQVNRAVAFYNSGRRSEIKHLDQNSRSTRLKFHAEKETGQKVSMGSVIEVELSDNNTRNTDIGERATATRFRERKLEAYAKTDYGQLWVGQGETASNRAMDVDLSGTDSVSDGGQLDSFAGGVRFVRGSRPEASGEDRDRSIAEVHSEILGSSRKNRLMYVTPSYKGMFLQVSHATRDFSDIALRYAGKYRDIKIAMALGYAHSPFDASGSSGGGQSARKIGRRDYGGSLSVLFPSGWSVGAGIAQRAYAIGHRRKGTSWFGKLGYAASWFSLGKSSLAVTYGQAKALFDSERPDAGGLTSNTFLEDNSQKIDIVGLYWVQAIDAFSSDIYVGYQWHRLQRLARRASDGAALTPYNFKPIHALLMGMRVKF